MVGDVGNFATRAFETNVMAAKDEEQSGNEATTGTGLKDEDINPMVTWAADMVVETALLTLIGLEMAEVMNFEV